MVSSFLILAVRPRGSQIVDSLRKDQVSRESDLVNAADREADLAQSLRVACVDGNESFLGNRSVPGRAPSQ